MGDKKFTRESYHRKTIEIDLGMCCLQYCTIIYLFPLVQVLFVFTKVAVYRITANWCFSLQFLSLLLFLFSCQSVNRPLACSGHIVCNKLCWDASFLVGLSKQSRVRLDWYEFLCFGNPTV